MHEGDQKDFQKFLSELQRETDRGLALVSASLIDEKLYRTLKAYFCEGKASEQLLKHGTSPLGTFSARTDACFALGLIDDFEYREIVLVRKIRNEFAHSIHGITFKEEKIAGLCSSLESDLPKGAGYSTTDPRFRYTNSVISLVSRIYYRPEWVAKEKRTIKTWVEPDQVRWRSVDEELPPKGAPVLVMGKVAAKRNDDE